MAVDTVALLKKVAKRFGKSVRRMNAYDGNVCKSSFDPKRPWEVLALPGDMFCHRLDISVRGQKVRLRANAEFLVAEIPTATDLEVISINRRDKVFQLEETALRVPDFPLLKIYSRSIANDPKLFLESAVLRQALGNLQLGEAESLHIYGNGPVLYFQPRSLNEALSAIESLCDLVEKLPPLHDTAELGSLPVKFKRLLPLIRAWAVDDDELRSEMLAQKSRKELTRFVTAVEPYFPAINDYLDSFGERAHSESAVALGRLAECAAEAKIILRDNQK